MYKSKICKLYDQIDSINEIVRLEIETNVIGSIIKSCKKNIILYFFYAKRVFSVYPFACVFVFSFIYEFLSNWRLFWIWNLKHKHLFTSDSHFTYAPQMFIELEIRWLVKITEWINLVFDTWKIRCIFFIIKVSKRRETVCCTKKECFALNGSKQKST